MLFVRPLLASEINSKETMLILARANTLGVKIKSSLILMTQVKEKNRIFTFLNSKTNEIYGIDENLLKSKVCTYLRSNDKKDNNPSDLSFSYRYILISCKNKSGLTVSQDDLADVLIVAVEKNKRKNQHKIKLKWKKQGTSDALSLIF